MIVRYFIISLVVHIIGISFIWIGFSAQGATERNTFTYLGGAQEEGTKVFSTQPFDPNMLKESSPAFFAPWVKMRELNKPK